MHGLKEPILPRLLERAKTDAETFAETAEQRKSDPKLVPRHGGPPTETVQIVSKPGRPTIQFVDVGGKYIEVEERLRRIAEGERRAKIKDRQRAAKVDMRRAGTNK